MNMNTNMKMKNKYEFLIFFVTTWENEEMKWGANTKTTNSTKTTNH